MISSADQPDAAADRLLSPQQVAALVERRVSAGVAGLGGGADAAYEELAAQIAAHCPRTNLAREAIDPSCLGVVRAEEAWSALVLPLRMEDGVLVCAAASQTLDRAISLLQKRSATPYRFLIAPVRQIEQYVCQMYDYEGLDIGDVA